MGDAHKPEEQQEGNSAMCTDIAIAEVETTVRKPRETGFLGRQIRFFIRNSYQFEKVEEGVLILNCLGSCH